MNKKKKILPVIGISLMAVSIALFCWYEWLGGRELINYQDVIVLNKDLQRGQLVTENDLTYLKIDKNLVIKDSVQSENEIVGLEAKHFIPAKEQLNSKFFEDAKLLLNKGEYVAKIPAEWVLAVPDSMRRGDDIVIYAVASNNNPLQQQHVATSKSDLKKNDKSSTSTEQDDNEMQTMNSEEMNSINTQSLSPILATKVAYVKDSANREVVTVGDRERMDGSSAIQSVEIITTSEKFKNLETQVKNGAKLILMYSDAEEEK